MAYGCADTIVAAIGNGFVKCSCTDRKPNLVGFDDDLSKKSIQVETDATDINLPNVIIIYQVN